MINKNRKKYILNYSFDCNKLNKKDEIFSLIILMQFKG